ncbi:uncharacterized protein LOC119642241 isoform X1 [Glossina fuscipes]|uniref:polynucleotide adenylyltransferase n=2 Tax=Glossina fuscipes TaxID=7396 RepID=A0A9C5ZIJ1_9MUSC|nr:uncharacterized protein LOC119642241 isoform X1 [Glossina fuscipes]XP_037897232.1 uncharacterized protein LOC119642241 isoform X1 [Glossina fuscipes]
MATTNSIYKEKQKQLTVEQEKDKNVSKKGLKMTDDHAKVNNKRKHKQQKLQRQIETKNNNNNNSRNYQTNKEKKNHRNNENTKIKKNLKNSNNNPTTLKKDINNPPVSVSSGASRSLSPTSTSPVSTSSDSKKILQKSIIYHNSNYSYAQTVGTKNIYTKTTYVYSSNSNNNSNGQYNHLSREKNKNSNKKLEKKSNSTASSDSNEKVIVGVQKQQLTDSDLLTSALTKQCVKPLKSSNGNVIVSGGQEDIFNDGKNFKVLSNDCLRSTKQYRKTKSYVFTTSSSRRSSISSISDYGSSIGWGAKAYKAEGGGGGYYSQKHQQQVSGFNNRRYWLDRDFAERNKGFVPILPLARPILTSSNIAAVIADTDKLTIIHRLGKSKATYPIMQCGTLDAPDSSYHKQRSDRMDVYQIDDGFHSDGGTETPPPSPSSGSSIASTSDHGSLESVDTGGTQRLAVLSFEQVRKLHHVMDEKVAIHGRGNFPTLEVTLKDLVNLVRRKLEADVGSGGAGVIVKDVRLNGGAASHVLASEDQPYNDLDLIYAIELSSSRHFDRVKTAVLNSLLDLLPEGVSKRRILPCALKEAYVGKMVKVNNNNDGDRWSLISLGNSPGHKNVELKFVDTMRRQFEFSVDSFQIVLDSLLLFYDCAALPISENFYPTVVGESVHGDFQEALYHLQKKLISTRQPEEIRGGGLLKYCNLLVRNYKPVDSQRIKTLERYMCSRFFIDFPDINTQRVKLEAYLRNHFWGIDEEPLQYQYLMHLRDVVENSTVCLMGHERRQTLMLIQSLAAQVLYKEQQKQVQEQQYHQHQQQHHQQQQQHQHHILELQQQQHQSQQANNSTVTLMTSTSSHSTQQQQQSGQPTATAIYVQQPQTMTATATICCAMPANSSEQQQQQQQQQSTQQQQTQNQTNAAAMPPQTIQIQAGPPGLIYANGVYYAPVIPTTICTCNSTWLST